MEFIGSYYLPIIMFGNKEDYYPYFKELFLRIEDLSQRINYLTKLLSSEDKEDNKSIIEPTVEKPSIIPTEPTITIQQPTNTPITSNELPTEDRASLLQKYKDIIARLQTQPKGSPEREQTIKEYREIKEKLSRLK